MITFFTIPKTFAGHSAVIQLNAAESWRRLLPRCEVLLMGNDPGVAETAAELGLRHFPDVACNEFGTPLLDSAFRLAAEHAKFPLLCYINADIMLLDDFPKAAARLKQPRFLMVGQRWDLDLTAPWDFSATDWEERLAQTVRSEAKLHPAAGSDYFLFRKGDPISELPPLAVGRQGWDNWFLANARRQKVPIIDATTVTTVIHQNHDYRHVPQGKGSSYEGPESRRNMQIIGEAGMNYTLEDADYLLKPEGLRPAWSTAHFKHRWTRMVSERAAPVILLLALKLGASRVKRLFVPYPEGYKPRPFKEEIAGLFASRRAAKRGGMDKS